MSLKSLAIEWLKGCSGAAGNNPEACEECTRAYREAVVRELAMDNTQVVSAGPNDVVVLKVPYRMDDVEIKRTRERMAAAFPYSRCAILEAGVEIQVVSARARRFAGRIRRKK